jgi:hypothetical protein
MHIQPKSKYPKVPRASAFTRELNAALEKEAKRFNVSKSFVIAVALADALGVDYAEYITLDSVNRHDKNGEDRRKS